jgi:hypothetical protein
MTGRFPRVLAAGMSRRRRLLILIAVAVAAGALAGTLIAYFSGAASAGSAGGAAAGTLPAGNTPALSRSGRDVSVTWNQNSFQSDLLGNISHGGYVITRYAENDPATPIGPGSACGGTRTGTADPLECTERGADRPLDVRHHAGVLELAGPREHGERSRDHRAGRPDSGLSHERAGRRQRLHERGQCHERQR